LSSYTFSPIALLLGANCRHIHFQLDAVTFTSNKQQAYNYTWQTLDPKIKRFSGAFFDTLVLTWDNQRIRLNGIKKRDVDDLISRFYSGCIEVRRNDIMRAHGQVSDILSTGYISHFQWQKLKRLLSPLQTWLKSITDINYIPTELQQPIARLQFWLQSELADLDKYNVAVVDLQQVKHQQLFDTLEAHPLTDKQCKACIVTDNSNLVLAGAGCGKTSVMLGRCAYLLASKQAQDDDILLLAFAKDAAQEMRTRLADKLPEASIKVHTFHALGLDIIRQVEGKAVKISNLASSEKAKTSFFKTQLSAHLENDEYLQLFSYFCYAYLTWQDAKFAELTDTKQQAEIDKIIAGKGQFKTVLTLLIELVMLYKNYKAEPARNNSGKQLVQTLAALGSEHLAVITIDIIMPLLDDYLSHLNERGEIDFDDMIAKAADYVRTGKYKAPWRHILVDEFQDISQGRANLIKLLQQQQEDCKLFCVGDDWQAIYQFAGSDIDVTTQFQSYFGRAQQLPLDTSFRFHDQISAVATRFIMQNPAQLTKQLTTFQQAKKPGVVIGYYVEASKGKKKVKLEAIPNGNAKMKNNINISESPTQAELLDEQVAKIATLKIAKSKYSVLILARFNYQLPDKKQLAIWQNAYENLTISAMTVHSSKGQEAQQVIVLGMESGQFGFPSEKPVFPLTQLLQPSKENYAHAEERRLFYVALTRAKKGVYLCCSRDKPSCFITELTSLNYPVLIDK